MKQESARSSFIRETLRIGLGQFKENRRVVDDLLTFFDTGTLPQGLELDLKNSLRVVRPRLLAIEDYLLAVRTVERRRHPLLPLVKTAFVTFGAMEEEEDVPPWRVVTDPNDYESHGSVAYTFTSAISLKENLEVFYKDVASPSYNTEI